MLSCTNFVREPVISDGGGRAPALCEGTCEMLRCIPALTFTSSRATFALASKVTPSLPKQVVSALKKSQPMLLNVNAAQRFYEFFRRPCKKEKKEEKKTHCGARAPVPALRWPPSSLSPLVQSLLLIRRMTAGITRDERELLETRAGVHPH